MYEIRLIVSRTGDALTAHWVESEGQESGPFPLALPLTAENAAELRWYLEVYIQFPGAGDQARAEGLERHMQGWGHALFEALFGTPEGVQIYNNLMGAAPPRYLTLGTTDPDVLAQPWEMARDRRGPLAFQGVTVRRQLQGSGRLRTFRLAPPLRVLHIVSRPTDAGFIDPRTSLRPVLDALDALPPGTAEADFCDPPTFARLEELVSLARRQARPYTLVHFDGHGTYLPLTGVGALAFERDDGMAHLVAGMEVGDLLARLEVPLVLLEACRSAGLSERPVFGSVAPALLESGVGSVVAFSHAVHVEAARLLVERFYRELGAGLSVGAALDEARAALHANPRRWLTLGPDAPTVDLRDWFIPQLYQVGSDPVLIERESREEQGSRGAEEQERTTPLPLSPSPSLPFSPSPPPPRPPAQLPPAADVPLPRARARVARAGACLPPPPGGRPDRHGRHGQDGAGARGGRLVAAHGALRGGRLLLVRTARRRRAGRATRGPRVGGAGL